MSTGPNRAPAAPESPWLVGDALQSLYHPLHREVLPLALLAWLPVHTLWSLMDGWGRLVHEVDRATSFEQVEEASAKFSKLMGENTAHVLVLVVTAAITGGATRFGAQLSKLPGFALAEARAGAQGVSLATAGEVEVAAAAEEQTFTLMVRRPGSRAAAAAEEAAEGRAGVTVIIRHQGGNRLVLYNNNQRWHVPAGRSIKDIPPRDPVGDNLVAAAREIRNGWSLKDMGRQELKAFDTARAKGEYWKAHLLEAEARGRYVHAELKLKFPQLKWNHKGVDAVDPNTGIQYEILTRTESNMARHGRRMAEELFRMIGF